MSWRPAPPAETAGTDVSRLLGLHTETAHLVLGMFIVSNVLFTFATAEVLEHAWMSYVAMVVVSAAGVVIVRPHPDPFPVSWTLLVLGAVVVSSLLVSLALPPDGELGRATWHLGSNTWLLWFLVLRRRAWSAWAGALLMVAVEVAWGVWSGRGAMAGILLMDTQIGLLLVATLFAVALRRTAARINELTARSVDAAALAAASEAAHEIRRQRVEELAASAVPLLERIAEGSDLTDADRRDFARVEAQLRDSVRGRSLALPVVNAAVARARGRGVEVTLLDDRGSPLPSGEAMTAIGDQIAAALDAADEGAVTVRLLPAGRDTAVTVVTRRGEATTRLTLTGEGVVAI